MSDDDDSRTRVLTRKEHARLVRRQAYQRAKEQRAKDPRYLALKEKVKAERRALYQKVKEQRKAEARDRKAKETEHRAEARAAQDEELRKLLRLASKGSDAQN